MSVKSFNFNELGTADLVVDAVYEGGCAGNAGDDPISKLFKGAGNQGGFRTSGRAQKKFVILYTDGANKDWPDLLDFSKGQFVYFGDNRIPGKELHDTPKGGNQLLKDIYTWLHSDPPERFRIPPIFVFSKCKSSRSARSVQFRGMVVPGFEGVSATDDLVAIWKTSNNKRFQNYKAIFTILDIPQVSRLWLNALSRQPAVSSDGPTAWRRWRETGIYQPLQASPTAAIRSIEMQRPKNSLQRDINLAIFHYFKARPVMFEKFAAAIFQLFDQRVIIDQITQGAVDGGRDAVGRYLLGLQQDPVIVEFSLEAKCYNPGLAGERINLVGVKDVARLISRLRQRQFGVLVTTAAIGKQAYQEIRADQHPVIFLSGGDIAEILIEKGFNTVSRVEQMLSNEYPLP